MKERKRGKRGGKKGGGIKKEGFEGKDRRIILKKVPKLRKVKGKK